MTEVYYIFFSKSDRWFDKFLHKGFSHVFVYKHIDKELYVQLQPAWHLEVDVVHDIKKSFNDVKNIYNMKIIKIEMDPKRVPKRFMSFLPVGWGVYNCVILVKYMLGLRSWCFTPYGLFNNLTQGWYKRKNKHLFNVEVV